MSATFARVSFLRFIEQLRELQRTKRKKLTRAKVADIGPLSNFRPGQFLAFHRAVKGIAKNETVEVVQVEDKQVIVCNSRGKKTTISAKQAKAFDVLERWNVEIASGDKLLLTANRREPAFHATNGEIVTVSE